MTPGIPLYLHVGVDYFNSLVASEKIDCNTIIYVAGPFGAHLSRGGHMKNKQTIFLLGC